MNGELLLHWMSSMGEGGWPAFRRAVENLLLDEARQTVPLTGSTEATNEVDAGEVCTGLRYRLVELGHVAFDSSRRWRVEPPRLLGFEHQPNRWYLAGARSPLLLARLRAACAETECTLESEEWPHGLWLGLPLRWWVLGPRDAVARVADAAGIKLLSDGFSRFRRGATGVRKQWENAPHGEPMHGWATRSFDLHARQWVESTLPDTVQEYSSGYDALWLVEHGGTQRRLPKREAVYAAAALRHHVLARYDPEARAVSVPIGAPLPEACAQLLCLTAGRPSRASQGFVFYDGVPPIAAALVFEAVGQMFPAMF